MKLSKLAAAVALSLAAPGGQAEASVVIDIAQDHGNVVATGSGTIDLTGLTYSFSGSVSAGVIPNAEFINVGEGNIDGYAAVSGPGSFGSGGATPASSWSGEPFGLNGTGFLAVPSGYVSGFLSGSSTFDNATFASLGLTPGTYVYTWGSGADADSLTVKIGAIPEPSTWAMMLLGFVGLGFAGYRAARASAAPTA